MIASQFASAGWHVAEVTHGHKSAGRSTEYLTAIRHKRRAGSVEYPESARLLIPPDREFLAQILICRKI
jgi:hypothetical protein